MLEERLAAQVKGVLERLELGLHVVRLRDDVLAQDVVSVDPCVRCRQEGARRLELGRERQELAGRLEQELGVGGGADLRPLGDEDWLVPLG